MRIMVLGGDGYLGWPTALHLSACGHDVAVASSVIYSRRVAVNRHARAVLRAYSIAQSGTLTRHRLRN